MDLLKEIGNAERIAISGHVRPDGDCVGSTLAMYNYLNNALKKSDIFLLLEGPSDSFSFLQNFEKIDSSYKYDDDFDVFIALDCGDVERLGDAKQYFESAKKTICFDHHISNKGYAEVSIVDAAASSTCELIFRYFEKQYMDSKIAECIYTGIVHDTGVFQYSCATRTTFEAIAELMDYEFDSSRIIDESFYQKTYVQNQILGRALLESIMFMDGRCIASCVDKKIMDFYGVTSKDLDGIVNQLRVTKGVEVAIFMYEIKTLEYKVSMRSNGKVDVAKIASFFGGGGHVRAAGVTMNGTMHDVLNNISEYIEMQL